MNNIYHRYLDLPFEITRHPMFDTAPKEIKHHDINPYRDAQVDQWHESLGLTVNHTEVFYTPPGGELPIHSDEVTLDNHVKINITWGPAEGTIRWWESKNAFVSTDYNNTKNKLKDLDHSTVDQFSQREHKNVLANKEECDLVWEASTNRPSLVNVGQLHSTYNPTDLPRWTLCFVPGRPNGHGYIYWDEALEIYKDYLL